MHYRLVLGTIMCVIGVLINLLWYSHDSRLLRKGRLLYIQSINHMGSIFLIKMSVQKMFSCKMFNLLICLCLPLSWCFASRQITMSSEPPSPCPTWMYRQSLQDKGCTCGDDLHDAVTCLPDKYSAYVIKGFCIVLNEGNSTALIGTCPYSTGGKLPKNISDAKDFGDLCFPLQ